MSKKQYINVVANSKQLKIDHRIIEDSKIITNEQSTFLFDGENIPEDALFKLQSLQKNIEESYVTTLLNDPSIKIIDKTALSDLQYANLNSTKIITCDTNILFEIHHRFEKSGIDFIFSPFSILNLHIEPTLHPNKINALILENSFYILITNGTGEIVYSDLKSLTSFEKIGESDFYENEVIRQKLFDEVYLLEVLDYLNAAMTDYYQTAGSKSEFIQSIDILYTLKQLSQNQINLLKEELMMDVNYQQISVDESLYELAKKEKDKYASFIYKRDKKTKSKRLNWTLALAGTTAAAAVVFYFINISNDLNVPSQTHTDTIPSQKTIKQESIINLPNHIRKNSQIHNQVITIFDMIPYNVLLQELSINKDDSTIIAEFLEKDTYIKDIQPKLLELYKTSEISFKDDKAKILTGIIKNDQPKEFKNSTKHIKPKYIIDEFITKERVKEQITALMPKNSIIKYQSKFKSNTITFNYLVNTVINSPVEFFSILEEMNKELYSINISYPINFRKTAEGIEIEFNLQFHQGL